MLSVAELERIAVLGTGEEGCLLAVAASVAGCAVRLHGDDSATLDRAQETVRLAVEAQLRSGRLGPADRQRALDGIFTTTDLLEAVTHADLVLVAGEGPGSTHALVHRLGESCRASAIVAARGGPSEELAALLPSPGRLLGLCCPRAGDELIELSAGPGTPGHVRERAGRFSARLARGSAARRS